MVIYFTNVLVYRRLLNLWLEGGVLTPGISKATGIASRPKALPCWLRVTLRKLVELYVKVSFQFNTMAVSQSLLKQEIRLQLELKSSLILSYPSS